MKMLSKLKKNKINRLMLINILRTPVHWTQRVGTVWKSILDENSHVALRIPTHGPHAQQCRY